MDWYKLNIEEPIRHVVKALRDNGINTVCSCGHGMWVQCESYDQSNELNTIYHVLIKLGYDNYRAQVFDEIRDGQRYTNIQITFPDENGEYAFIQTDNKNYTQYGK